MFGRLSLIPALTCFFAICSLSASAERMRFLENAQIRIGVDLDVGGAIAFLADKRRGENLVNTRDRGRYIQQSYYSGPQPFGAPHPAWKNWAWNPIGAGDVYGNPARVITFKQDAKSLYIKTLPMQWALRNVPGDCVFETWITLQGDSAQVRHRLTNQRKDKTQYPARDQELPALYTTGKYSRLFTYDGAEPFRNQPLREIKNAGPPWATWRATEHWAALVDETEQGVGLFHPGVYRFLGGFHGKPGAGGSKDNPTGYIAPVRPEILDHDIVYDYAYTLVVGTLQRIREFAVANRQQDTRPDYHFRRDRQHWTYQNASDTGMPRSGALRVQLESSDPQMMGPEQWWQAEDAPQLTLRAAFHTRQKRATIFWRVLGEASFSDERRVAFDILPDGQFHTYVINLAESPRYKGTITGLRFDPVSEGSPGDYMDIAYLSWR